MYGKSTLLEDDFIDTFIIETSIKTKQVLTEEYPLFWFLRPNLPILSVVFICLILEVHNFVNSPPTRNYMSTKRIVT